MNYGRRRTIVAARTALEQEKKNAEIKIPEERQEAPVLGRGLCPKCKVKPNHFFHVKWCKG